MKKISVLLFLSLIIFATACKKDKKVDPPAPTKDELIVGDWTLESISSDDGVILTEVAGMRDTTTFTVQSKDENYTMEVNENKSYSSSGGLTLSVATTDSDGLTTVRDTVIADTTSTGTWLIRDDVFELMDSDGDVTDSKILELTDKKLKLETKENDTTMVSVFGFDVTLITTNTNISVFKK